MNKNQIWLLVGALVIVCMCVTVGGIAAYVVLDRQVDSPSPAIAATAPVAEGENTALEALETVSLTDGSGGVSDPLIAFDGNGVLHLVYQQYDDKRSNFLHQQRSPAGAWSAPQTLGAEFDELDRVEWLLRNPAGQVCAFGDGSISNSYSLFMSCLEDGQWSPLSQVTRARSDPHPVFAADGSIQSVSNPGIRVTFQDITLSDETKTYEHAFTIDSNDGYHVVWERRGDPFTLEYRYSNDGGQTWSEQERLAGRGTIPTVLLADGQGNVHLALHHGGGQRFYSRWTPAGGWEGPVDFGCCSGSADMAIDTNGLPHIVWSTMDGGLYTFQSVNGEWRELPLDGAARIAVDQQGGRHFVWEREGGLYYAMMP